MELELLFHPACTALLAEGMVRSTYPWAARALRDDRLACMLWLRGLPPVRLCHVLVLCVGPRFTNLLYIYFVTVDALARCTLWWY